MVSIQQNGEVYEIRFKYDLALIDIIRNVPGRRWVPNSKIWTIPKDMLGFLLNEARGTPYESVFQIQSDEHLNENATIDATEVIPYVDISQIKFHVKEGFKPYDHQLDFMKYALDRDKKGYRSGFILGDDPGLGKTLEVANLAIYRHNDTNRQYKHCLIVCCINTSKYNWYEDIVEHTNGEYEPYMLGSRMKRNGKSDIRGSKEKFEDLVTGHMYGDKACPELPYFLIINIEAIRYKVGKKYPITEQIVRMVNDGQLQMIAIDEIHKNASPKSTQGKQLLEIKKATGTRVEWIPMTGTPITKSPLDAFTPLKLVDGHGYSSFYMWSNQFCVFGGYGGHDVLGYKNIPRLKNLLQSNMLRRRKDDVLNLPPKIHITEYVENTLFQQKLYHKVTDELCKERGIITASMNPMSRFLRLRQVNGSPELVDLKVKAEDKDYLSKNAKLVRLMELLEQTAGRGEKTIIFSNWVEPLRTIYKYVSKKYKTCCFTGTMDDAAKQMHKRVFINNPEYTVLLGTIGAMGTSHTFTVAKNVIFYDEPWNPSDKEQAEDRAHRIGTDHSLNIYTIITRNTVDDKVHDILYRKKGISSYIVDNKLDLKNHPELFDILTSID